jgi:RimJ/RimL family protein N-acetyltransferase
MAAEPAFDRFDRAAAALRIETPRLVLRLFDAGDLDAYAAMTADPEAMRFIGSGATLARADAWRQLAMFVGHWRLRGHGMWAIERRDTGALIGRAGFLEPEGWPGCELAWLLDRASWGQGYATEAARAALAFGFERLGLGRVISLIYPDNLRSIRVAERLGQHFDGEIDAFGARVRLYSVRRAVR